MSPNRTLAPNWFVAVPVPASEWYVSLVEQPPDDVRRFHAEDLHITVAFLGAVGEQAAQRGWQALRWNLSPLYVSLGSVIPMGNPRHYSALSIELVEGRKAVEAAITNCRDAICDAAGARREMRSAKAHVTIARPNRRASEDARQAAIHWAKRVDLKQQIVKLDSVALYTWADDRRERQFKVVTRIEMV